MLQLSLRVAESVFSTTQIGLLYIILYFQLSYRRAVFDEQVDAVLREVCLEIEKRYEIKFVEIGVDKDHVHFLVQSVPTGECDETSNDAQKLDSA
jgi:REP element-mobilizing transposase RayT